MTFRFFTACVLALASLWVLLPYAAYPERSLVVVVRDQVTRAVPVRRRRRHQRRAPDSPDH